MFICDLRTETVHLIVISCNADDARAINLSAEDLRLLQVGGNEDAGAKASACCLRRYRVGQVAGRGAAHNVETKIPRLGKGHSHHTVFKTERGKTDSVIFEIKRLCVEHIAQPRSLQ